MITFESGTSPKSTRALVQSGIPNLDFSMLKKVHKSIDVEKSLVALDELCSSTRYKIGVFNVKAGQRMETEYLSNRMDLFNKS